MIIRTVLQPETQLGNEIIELLDSEASYSRIVLVSAFVALRTILRLRERLLTHVSQRNDLLITIGIDLGGTSREVLEELLRWNCRVFVFHNTVARATFHPKVYLFERSSAATLFVGSNNLTDGGLYTNYEVATRFDFSFPADTPEYENLLKPLSQFLNPEGDTVRPLDKDLIQQLIARGEILTEAEARRHTGKRTRDQSAGTLTVPASPFSAVKVPYAPSLPKELRKEDKPSGPIGSAPADALVLVRYIAGAGGRTSQAHFSRRIAESFFGLRPGDPNTIDVQEVQPGEHPGRLEKDRPLVFSTRNRNSRIEMEGLKKRLPSGYPTSWYAILVVQQVEPRRYRYMSLVPGDDGYAELSGHLDRIPRRGQAFQEDTMKLDKLLEIWPSYPV